MRNVKPLELYLLNDYFIRGAKKPFTMDEATFQDRDVHLTTENVPRAEYEGSPACKADWLTKVKKAITAVFVAFEARHGEEIERLGNKAQSRALYGVDLSVDQDGNAKVLELTNNPDFKDYHQFPA